MDWSPAVRRATHLPVFIFIHGRFGEAEMWFPLVRGLALRYRCVTIDLPGHGRSALSAPQALTDYSRLLTEVIVKLDCAFPILVGHDIGGALALLQGLFSGRHVPLILINSSSPCLELAGPPIGKWGGTGLGARLWLRKLIRSCPKLREDHAQLLKAPWSKRETRHGMIKAWESYEGTWPAISERAQLQRKASDYACPVLLLWGSFDPLHPVEEAITMIRHLPDSTLYQRGCGHWPCLEEPEWVETKIKEFLFHLEPSSAYFSTGF